MFGIETKLALGMLVICSVLGIGFKVYFNYANAKIDKLNKANTQLELSLVNVKNNYNTLQEQVDKLNENLITLEKNRNDIYNNNSREKIIFEDHDLGKLIIAKPKLMEDKINKAIEKRFKDFEEL